MQIPLSPIAPMAASEIVADQAVEQARKAEDLLAAQKIQRIEARDKIDSIALDPDSYFSGKDLGFTRDPEKTKAMALNSAYMEFETDGAVPAGESDIQRKLLRQRIAMERFGGNGADDEMAFNAEIKKSAQGRKDTGEVFTKLGDAAQTAAAVSLGSHAKPQENWLAAREEISKMPGYKPSMDADFQQAFYEMENASKEAIAPYADELTEVFDGWKSSTGAGKAVGVASGLIQDAFLGGQGETDAALEKKSTRRTAFEVYDKLSPEEQPAFLQALGVIAAKLPKEERPEFFANVAKSGGRALETLAQGVKTTGEMMPRATWESVLSGTEGSYAKSQQDRATASKARKQADFVQKVQNLQEGVFDPVKKISKSYLGKLGETVAYGTPGVLATSFAASNPYTGSALLLSLTESHYQSILAATEGEMGYDAASRYSSAVAPVAAGLETVSEYFGSSLLRGKLPFFDKALTRAMDGIKNPLARGAVRFAAGATESGVQEIGQNYIDQSVRAASEAFGVETGTIVMPDAQENVEAFASVFPLALMGIPGAAGRDARVAAFGKATDLQLSAAGYKDVQGIRDGIAKGLDSGAAAIDSQERDPTTPEAIAAQKELQAQLVAEKEAASAATLSGVLPTFVKTPDGWSVRDGETGQEFGVATNEQDAMRIAETHSAAIDQSNENQTAFLYTMLEAGAKTTESNGGARQTGFEFSPGQKLTATQEAALSPQDEARVMEQAAARQAMGGDPEMSAVVLGKSVTEFKNKVRNTVNNIFGGGTILTVVHEETHGFFREALAQGRITKEGAIEAIRGFQGGLREQFLPESGEVSDTQLDEAVSELQEVLLLKNRKKDGTGAVSKNLSAFSKINAKGKSLKSFTDSVNTYFGQVFSRLYDLKKSIREGKVKESDIEAFISKVVGLNQQDEHNAAAVKERDSILSGGAFSISGKKGYLIEPNEEASPHKIQPRNRVESKSQVEQVAKIYEENNGWIGRPLLAYDTGENYQALTGSHRLSAAKMADVDAVPLLVMDLEALSEWWDENPSNFIMGAYEFANSTREEDQLAALKEAKSDGFEAAWLDDSIALMELEDESNNLDRSERSSFSMGPAAMADVLQQDAMSRVTNSPKAHLSVMAALSKKIGELKGDIVSISEGRPPALRVRKTNEAFDGAQHEQALIALDEERAAAKTTHEEAMADLRPSEQAAEKKRYEDQVAKFDKRQAALDKRGAVSDEKAAGDRKRNKEVAETKQKLTYEKQQLHRDILAALAMFDGILSVLPTNLRGKVGGYTTLASLTTDEARLKYLQTRVDKVEKVANDYLKKEYTKQLDKLFDRAKPAKGKAGEKPKGKVGADVHELFDVLRAVRGASQDDVDAHIAGLEAAINSGNLTPEQAAHKTLEAALVGLVGNWKEADTARRAAAVTEATRIFEKGYATFKLAQLQQAEDRKIHLKALQQDTGKTGGAGERDAKLLADNGLKGGWKDNFLSLISFEQLTEYLFGRDSKEAIRIVDMERKAANLKEDSTQADMDALDELFTRLGDGSQLQGEKIRWELSQKNTKIQNRELSQLEMVKATMLWAQEDGRRHMLGTKDENGNYAGKWHYDQAFVDQVESKLSKEAKSVRAHLQEQYASEYDWLNPVFVELNGVNLPKNENYSPLTVTPQQAAQSQSASPVTGAMNGTSTTPGSLRSRGSAIAEPDFTDALQTYIAHRKEMRHWVAYAPFNVEVGSILRNRDLGNAVEAKGGKQGLSVMRGWMDYFTVGGVRDAAAHLALNQMMNRISGRAASSVLIGRMGVLAIQTTQLGAALAEMPTGSFAVRFGKLLTGQLGWGTALKSEYIQRRIQQMPVVVQQAMEGLKASKPNILKHQVQKIGKLIGGVDGLMTAGTYAICYDYQLKQAKGMGLSGPEAESYAANAAERAVDRVAQPTRAGTRSLFENTTTNPAGRILWAFASESRQKLSLSLWRLGASDRSLGEKARAVAVTWVVGGMVATLIRAAMRDVKDDDDEETFDEKNWGLKRLALSSVTGPFQGLPFIGDALEAGVYGVAGEYLPEGNMLSSIPKSLKAATQVSEWGEKKPDEIIRDVETILSGAALFSDDISAAASLSHLVRDLYGITENFSK